MVGQLVTLKQAVEMVPWLTERFARRLLAERRITSYRAGNKVLLDTFDIENFARAGKVEALR
jgi:hypothetical protein